MKTQAASGLLALNDQRSMGVRLWRQIRPNYIFVEPAGIRERDRAAIVSLRARTQAAGEVFGFLLGALLLTGVAASLLKFKGSCFFDVKLTRLRPSVNFGRNRGHPRPCVAMDSSHRKT
jgi:hypothetical protein